MPSCSVHLLALTPKYTCFKAPFCRDLWFLEGNCRPHCPRKALEVLRKAGVLAPRGGACEMPPYLFSCGPSSEGPSPRSLMATRAALGGVMGTGVPVRLSGSQEREIPFPTRAKLSLVEMSGRSGAP